MRNDKKSRRSIVIGSRQSDLARIQAYFVADQLKDKYDDLDIQFYHRPSFGDLNLDMDLKETNSRGVFTADFQGLLNDKICDLVVHSWKDLPIEENPETQIFTLTEREDQRDMLFLKKSAFGSKSLKVLTSSPRREYHLKKYLPEFLPFEVSDLNFEAIRGNIPTRFSKFLNSDAQGFVVAKAAVDRLMSTDYVCDGQYSDEFKLIREQILNVFSECHFMVLPLSVFPTAAAQGALALEVLKTSEFYDTIKGISDSQVYDLVMKERKTHKQYGGGCHQAMGFSSLAVDQGVLFYSAGTFNNEEFRAVEFTPYRKLNKSFKKEELFLPSTLNSEAYLKREETKATDLALPEGAEVVVTRFEAALECLKERKNTVWAAGLHTWKKLVQAGYWVNGTLDGLGAHNVPELDYLDPSDYIWLSNSKAENPNGLGPFQLTPVYNVNYQIDEVELKSLVEGKEAFYWTSGHSFEMALKASPAIKDKIHFCGLGRTAEVLKRHLKEEQIYFCLDENDFIKTCLS